LVIPDGEKETSRPLAKSSTGDGDWCATPFIVPSQIFAREQGLAAHGSPRSVDTTSLPAHSLHDSPLKEVPIVRSGALIVALVLVVLFVAAPATATEVEKHLLGVWEVQSFYTEFQGIGEKKFTFGQKPRGYLAFTPAVHRDTDGRESKETRN
jgi:hypothetical protein